MEGNFAIGLPGKPPAKSEVYEGSNGWIETHTYQWLVINHGLYSVSYKDITTRTLDNSSISQRILNNLRDTIVNKSKGKIKSDEDISISGYPGKEIIIEESKGVFITRLYLVKNRLYDLHIFLPNISKENKSAVTKIFDTFKLVQ